MREFAKPEFRLAQRPRDIQGVYTGFLIFGCG